MNKHAVLYASRMVVMLLLAGFILGSGVVLLSKEILFIIAISLLSLGGLSGLWLVFYEDYVDHHEGDF